ncbi:MULTISPECIES: McrC family protein [unclassified Pseudomonas]|uniref:McrC family protein n=1 Tax=unclassified Pseudomonas TaxID=196821 RepID=UPI0020985B26|nr:MULTISPECIES: McrC family protein [unclassified Pseudomonas]MCO7518854.1 McrC family protein [Pseudomonas sp. 1]MCO7539430.1 McrC family protein [Pseudomonas sp. VA159-2]
MKSENTKTLTIAEFKDMDVPESLLLPSGELLAYPEILERNFFSIRYKKGKPIFQAGGWVGVIPVNDKLSLNIIPKVPISNLERLVFLSNHKPEILKNFKRRYSPHDYSSKNLNEFLIDCLLKHIEEIINTGLYKKYARVEEQTLFPSGKINFNKTIRARAKLNGMHVVASHYERMIDNPPNRFLKKVCLGLSKNPEMVKDKHRRVAIQYALNSFAEVSDHYELHNAQHDPSLNIECLKENYRDAVGLAMIFISGKGLSFGLSGSTSANSLILNLAEAFEWYALEVLRSAYRYRNDIQVLDGNKGGADGGKKALLVPPPQVKNPIMATPDIVLKSVQTSGDSTIVIDVKYKSIEKLPDRDDLNQIISYAASYSASHGILIFPANDKNPSGINLIGELPGVRFYALFIDLNNSRIEEEEALMASRLSDLF